jgi:hypothetical protein
MIDTFLLVLRTRVRARRHIEDGLLQWMVTPRAYPNRRLREPFRAPKKIHRQIRQPVRQGNTLLVRQFAATAALHLLQERPLDRIGGGLVCGFAFVAVAPLLLGGREGHAAYAGMVTLPSSSPVHSAVRHGERGVVFIEEFREPAPPESPAVGDSYPLATLLFALGFPGPQGALMARRSNRICRYVPSKDNLEGGQVARDRDWHGAAHLRRASDESARGGAMSKGERKP